MNTLQYITDKAGNKTAVVLPIRQYEKMIEKLEELDDIRLYDEAKKVKGKSIPIDEAFKRIEDSRKKR